METMVFYTINLYNIESGFYEAVAEGLSYEGSELFETLQLYKSSSNGALLSLERKEVEVDNLNNFNEIVYLIDGNIDLNTYSDFELALTEPVQLQRQLSQIKFYFSSEYEELIRSDFPVGKLESEFLDLSKSFEVDDKKVFKLFLLEHRQVNDKYFSLDNLNPEERKDLFEITVKLWQQGLSATMLMRDLNYTVGFLYNKEIPSYDDFYHIDDNPDTIALLEKLGFTYDAFGIHLSENHKQIENQINFEFNRYMSDEWLKELNNPTELSKGMTLNEIQEKVSNHYSMSEYYSNFLNKNQLKKKNSFNNQKSNSMATEDNLKEEKVFKKFTGKLIDTKNGYIDNQIIGTILGIQSPKYNYYPEKLEILNNALEPLGKSLESLKGVTLEDLKSDLLKVVYNTNEQAVKDGHSFEKNEGPGNEIIRQMKEAAREIQDKSIELTKKFKSELSEMPTDELKALAENPDNKLNDYGKYLLNVQVEKRVVGELSNEELMDKMRESAGKEKVVSDELQTRLSSGTVSKDFVNESLMGIRFDFLSNNEGSILNAKNQEQVSFSFLELAYLKKPSELEVALSELKVSPEAVAAFKNFEHKFIPSEERNEVFKNLLEEINKNDVSKLKEITGLLPTDSQEQNQSTGKKR